jgi:hypothetical protein
MDWGRASLLLAAFASACAAANQQPPNAPEDATGQSANRPAEVTDQAPENVPSAVNEQGPANGTPAVTYAGGNGMDCANAIKIVGAPNSQVGVDAEYAWLAQHYPGYAFLGQALSECSGRPADILSIRTGDGAKREVYFDIGDFFGKF